MVNSSLIALDVTAAMLVERTIAKTSFGNLIILLCKTGATFFCFLAPTWPSYHVSAIKESPPVNPNFGIFPMFSLPKVGDPGSTSYLKIM